MKATEVINKLNRVPKDMLQSVSDYIDFILQKAESEAYAKKGRKLGALKGKLKIADDFDAPLDDFKDYM